MVGGRRVCASRLLPRNVSRTASAGLASSALLPANPRCDLRAAYQPGAFTVRLTLARVARSRALTPTKGCTRDC